MSSVLNSISQAEPWLTNGMILAGIGLVIASYFLQQASARWRVQPSIAIAALIATLVFGLWGSDDWLIFDPLLRATIAGGGLVLGFIWLQRTLRSRRVLKLLKAHSPSDLAKERPTSLQESNAAIRKELENTGHPKYVWWVASLAALPFLLQVALLIWTQSNE